MEFVVHPQSVQQDFVKLFDGKVSVTLMDERLPARPNSNPPGSPGGRYGGHGYSPR